MRPLTFKETVARDVRGVFLNLDEFADRHTVKYDGKVYEDIPVSLQDVEQTEQGKWLEINDGKNPKFFNKYQIGSSGVEMGMVRIELGRFAQ